MCESEERTKLFAECLLGLYLQKFTKQLIFYNPKISLHLDKCQNVWTILAIKQNIKDYIKYYI